MSRSDHDRRHGKGADADLRTLQVRQDGDRPSQAFFHFADQPVKRFQMSMRCVAHIDAESIRTGLEQGLNRLARGAFGTKRGYYFCVTAASHGRLPLLYCAGSVVERGKPDYIRAQVYLTNMIGLLKIAAPADIQ